VDFIAIGKAIADIGGWAAFLALVALIGVGGVRRWWVFGWIYDRSEKARETSDTQAERNADSLETSSKALDGMAKSYDRLERDFDRLASGRVNRE
jgi:hypothetical protein